MGLFQSSFEPGAEIQVKALPVRNFTAFRRNGKVTGTPSHVSSRPTFFATHTNLNLNVNLPEIYLSVSEMKRRLAD